MSEQEENPTVVAAVPQPTANERAIFLILLVIIVAILYLMIPDN
jgi:hypothetical protein